MFQRILRFIEKRVEAGEQAYVISPIIEESDALDIQNAVDLYENLVKVLPNEIKVGLMHGRLSIDEKEEVMKIIAQNDIQIILSTSVLYICLNNSIFSVLFIYYFDS